jgi:hypothetical protein
MMIVPGKGKSISGAGQSHKGVILILWVEALTIKYVGFHQGLSPFPPTFTVAIGAPQGA